MKTIHNIAIVGSLALLASCSNLGSPSAKNTSRAQFLDEVWVAPALKGKAPHELCSKVYFAPVAIGNLKRQGWWSSQSSVKQGQLDEDARKLARNFRQSLNHAARNDPGRRLTVVGNPGPDTLVVEMAITELVPAKAYWNAAATAAGFVVPGAGLLGAAGSGTVAIEGRVRDGNTGAVLATFRDRMQDKMAAVNVNAYSWYGGSERNLEEIAVKTARVLNADAGTVVKQSAPITLISY